jgi:hypothetical protein
MESTYCTDFRYIYGLIIDLKKGVFRAPIDKVLTLSKQPSALLGRAVCNARWVPATPLAAFAGKAQFLYLAIARARFIYASSTPYWLRDKVGKAKSAWHTS